MKTIAILTATIMVVTIGWLSVPTTATATNTTTTTPTCLQSITDSCETREDGDTNKQLSLCCIALKDAIANDRACFCLLKPYLDDPSSTDSMTTLFAYCKIDGSFDTLCVDSGSTPTTPSGDTSNDVPSTTPSTVPTTYDGGNGNGGGTGGLRSLGNNLSKKNGGSKMKTTSLYTLIIVFISLIITP